MGSKIRVEPLIFAGVENDPLATLVARALKMELAEVKYVRFQGAVPGGGETKPEVMVNVAKRHCVIVWSPKMTNDELMQILQLIDCLKQQGSCQDVILVVPCYPYARQDKTHEKREPVVAALVAKLLESVGTDQIIFLDIHAQQIEGFFRKTKVRCLWMKNIWVDFIRRCLNSIEKKYRTNKVVVLAPDAGALHVAKKLAESLSCSVAVNLKTRDTSKVHTISSLGLAGDVKDAIVIIVDDLVASGDSLFLAAANAKSNGAKYVMALATHAICFDKTDSEKTFAQKLYESEIGELVVTNTLIAFSQKVKDNTQLQRKVTILDISSYLALVIKRLESDKGETIREMLYDPKIKARMLYRIWWQAQKARG